MSDGEAFYAVAEMRPPASVKIKCLWPNKRGLGTPFICVRYVDPKSRKERWATMADGQIIRLPLEDKTPPVPSKTWIGFHNLITPEPQFWAPLSASTWSLPLPEPAYIWVDPETVPNRLWSARQAYTSVDAALDAEEMQRNRETVSQENETETVSHRQAQQWWRQAVGLRYDDPALLPEDLGKRMVAWRLHRAIHFAQPFRGYGRLHPQISPALQQLAMTQQDIRDRANNAPPDNELAMPIEMLPADDSDFLSALDWFLGLQSPGDGLKGPWSLSNHQKVLAYRSLALPRSFREIGDRLTPQVGDERARKIYHDALDQAWLIATGRKKNHTRDQIIALRERNRAFRRNQEGVIL